MYVQYHFIRPTSAVLGKAENTEIYRNQLYFSNVSQLILCSTAIYVRSLFGSEFNLTVWRFFVHPPNLFRSYYMYEAATAFRQVKVMPTAITDRFAKYLTRQ